jgi:hypothetical protein
MKKIFAILAAATAMLFCASNASAQDIILTRDSQIISAVVLEISDAEIVYKTYDNQEGPNYRIATSNVQKIRFANGTEQVFTAPAPVQQNVPQAFQSADRQASYNPQAATPRVTGHMEHTGGDFEIGGSQIYEGEYRNYFNADEFETVNGALRQRSSGKSLLITGGALAGVGIVFTAVGATTMWDWSGDNYYYNSWSAALYYSGIVFLSVGVTAMTVGAPLFCIGKARLNWAADSYNQRNAMSFNVVSGRNGLGLALRF